MQDAYLTGHESVGTPYVRSPKPTRSRSGTTGVWLEVESEFQGDRGGNSGEEITPSFARR